MFNHTSLNNSKHNILRVFCPIPHLLFKIHVQISRKSHDSIDIPDFTKRLINTFGIIGSRLQTWNAMYWGGPSKVPNQRAKLQKGAPNGLQRGWYGQFTIKPHLPPWLRASRSCEKFNFIFSFRLEHYDVCPSLTIEFIVKLTTWWTHCSRTCHSWWAPPCTSRPHRHRRTWSRVRFTQYFFLCSYSPVSNSREQLPQSVFVDQANIVLIEATEVC